MQKIAIIFLLLFFSPFCLASIDCSENHCLEQMAITSGTPEINVQTSIQEAIVGKQGDNQIGYLFETEPKINPGGGGPISDLVPTTLTPLVSKINITWIFFTLLLVLLLILLYVYRKKIKEKVLFFFSKTKQTGETIETQLPI